MSTGWFVGGLKPIVVNGGNGGFVTEGLSGNEGPLVLGNDGFIVMKGGPGGKSGFSGPGNGIIELGEVIGKGGSSNEPFPPAKKQRDLKYYFTSFL